MVSQLHPYLNPLFELEKRETKIPMLPEEKLRLREVCFFFKSLTQSHDESAQSQATLSIVFVTVGCSQRSVVLYGDPCSQWGWNKAGGSQGPLAQVWGWRFLGLLLSH